MPHICAVSSMICCTYIKIAIELILGGIFVLIDRCTYFRVVPDLPILIILLNKAAHADIIEEE